jgi:hypothetical protein
VKCSKNAAIIFSHVCLTLCLSECNPSRSAYRCIVTC